MGLLHDLGVMVELGSGRFGEVEAELQPGLIVRGRLDAIVPRPVEDGRVVAHVWPIGRSPQSDPPQWHAWTRVREDGTFEIGPLPNGELEVVAICNGFVSVIGPGQHSFRYPQKHVLKTNDIEITIDMEPTVRLELTVLDDQGRPVEGAQISTWPNVRYGDWAATILASDCYNTHDWLRGSSWRGGDNWSRSVPDFGGTSDATGVAVLPNLPSDVTSFSLVHTQYALPVVTEPGGEKHRTGKVTLTPGRTNRVSVYVEPGKRTTIRHY